MRRTNADANDNVALEKIRAHGFINENLLGYSVRTQLDITYWRERSARISLWLVDLPFFVLRTWLFLISANGGKPIYPPLTMKNVTCFFLQYMQLRVVEHRKAQLLDLIKLSNEAEQEYWYQLKKTFEEDQDKMFTDMYFSLSHLWKLVTFIPMYVYQQAKN